MTPVEAVLALKRVRRAGWVRQGHPDAESVADHSFGVAMLCLLNAPPELDREKLLIMALLHDLAEAVVGDITPHDAVPPEVKHAREDAAMTQILDGRPDLLAIWREAEQHQSPEARFLKQMDRAELRAQALDYRDQIDVSEFLR